MRHYSIWFCWITTNHGDLYGNATVISCTSIFLITDISTNRDVSLTVRGRLHSSCVRSRKLHRSETSTVRKDNEVALQRQRREWLDGCVALSYKIEFQVKGWERLGLDDIISVLQQNRLWWYGHVLRKEDNDWVKKCMEYEVEGARPRGRPKKTWRDCWKTARHINWTERMLRMVKNEADKGWLIILIGVSG